MKKNVIRFLVLVMMSVLVFVSCYRAKAEEKTVSTVPANKVTFTGLTFGDSAILILWSLGGNIYGPGIAYGKGEIINGSVTIELHDYNDDSIWTGTGSYQATLSIHEPGAPENDYTRASYSNKLDIKSSSETIALKDFSIFKW